MAKPKDKSKFQSNWILKFGLEVMTRDVTTNEVTSVMCLFCRQCGREDEEEVARKRKRTLNAKYFGTPWRSDNFSSHMKKNHPMKWKEYCELSMESKKNFFIKEEHEDVINMRSFVQPEGSMKARIISKQKCKFIIDADIVKTLIGNLLFDESVEEGKCKFIIIADIINTLIGSLITCYLTNLWKVTQGLKLTVHERKH